jgi:hypothetical protein
VVVRDVFAGEPELFERFKKFIGFTSDDELGTGAAACSLLASNGIGY